MAEQLPDLVAKLRLDLSEAQRSVGKAAALGGALGGAIGGIVGGIAQEGIARVGDFFRGAISGASDLNETISKVGVLFGPAAGQIEAFANTADTKLGQTKQQAMDAAATFAVFGKSAGLQGSELAGFSTHLTTLASDMASFSNTSPEQAIDAIGAALRGETEPIRQYGVLIDDASTRQEALKLGLVKTTKEALTPQQRVLAVQALIMKQTTAAQGDFARTSSGLANSQRIASAEFENAKTKLGSLLLPVVLAITRAFIAVIPWISQVASWVRIFLDALTGNSELNEFDGHLRSVNNAGIALQPVLRALWGFIQQLGASLLEAGRQLLAFVGWLNGGSTGARLLRDVIIVVTAALVAYNAVVLVASTYQRVVAAVTRAWMAAQLALNAVMSLNPIGLVVIAVVALIAVIVLAYRQSATFRAIVQGAWAGVRAAVAAAIPIFRQVWAAVSTSIGGIVQIIRGLVRIAVALFHGDLRGVLAGAREVFGGVLAYFRGIPALIVRALGNLGGLLLGAGGDLISGLIHGITGAAGRLIGAIKSTITDKLPGFVKKALGINSPSRVFAELGSSIPEGLALGIYRGSNAVAAATGAMLATAGVAAAASSGAAGSVAVRGSQDLSGLPAALAALAARPVVLQLDGREIARAQDRRAGSLLDDRLRR